MLRMSDGTTIENKDVDDRKFARKDDFMDLAELTNGFSQLVTQLWGSVVGGPWIQGGYELCYIFYIIVRQTLNAQLTK
jgi:hypothetical protein